MRAFDASRAYFQDKTDAQIHEEMMQFPESHPSRIAGRQLLTERQAKREAEQQAIELARHNESIQLAQSGNKHAQDAVFWAIVASILAGIGVLISVLAWMDAR